MIGKPDDTIRAEEVLGLVRENGKLLSNVPVELRTPWACFEAVLNYPGALAYVPRELRTPELCLEAVRRDGFTLRFVPQELQTEELRVEAVIQNPRSLRFIPRNQRRWVLEALEERGSLVSASEESSED